MIADRAGQLGAVRAGFGRVCVVLACPLIAMAGCSGGDPAASSLGATAPPTPDAVEPGASPPPREATAGAPAPLQPSVPAPSSETDGSPPASPTNPGSPGPGPAPGDPPTAPTPTPSAPDFEVQWVETEQTLVGVRPELLDWLWNNLDAEHFTQWHPEGHSAFAWLTQPQAPGDLGAEVDASYESTEMVGGQAHELTVTYVDRASVTPALTTTYAMAAQVTLDDMGPLSWTVAYEIDDLTLTVRQRMQLPMEADRQAWSGHLQRRIEALGMFLPPWFQSAYVEGELLTRGSSTVTNDTAAGVLKLRVEQHIDKLTPEMVDWWWDNINTTARYRRWHPTAHIQFTWLTEPQNQSDLEYDVGAVQQVVETIGTDTTLDIGWLEPSGAPVELTYSENYVYGSAMLAGTPFGGFLLHEYGQNPDGGITMISHFEITNLAEIVTMNFGQLLADHCQQEMQFLQYFLPALYEAEHQP